MDAARPNTLLLLSGGIDSSSLIPFLSTDHGLVIGLFVNYGQAAAGREHAAASSMASHFDIPLICRTIPESRPKSKGVIPGRNAFLLTLAFTELPTSRGQIAIGIHAGTEYVDCSPAFVDQMQQLADLYFCGTVQIIVPFLRWSKRDIWNYARERIPLDKTYSCELGLAQPCGQCLSCQDLGALHACT